jgi:molybdopterin-binding protein
VSLPKLLQIDVRHIGVINAVYTLPLGKGQALANRVEGMRRLNGRNQLVGRIESVRVSGLMAEVVISIGEQQITSIITARSAREMNLKAGQTAAALIKSTEVMILRV